MTNALNDGTLHGTVSNLAKFMRFLSVASSDPEICEPGLHQAILQASVTLKEIEEKQYNVNEKME